MNTPTELQRVIFEGSDPGPHLLITGGVHGDEFEPIVAIRKLIEHFGSNSSCGMSKVLLTLVPIVNEAAYLRGSRTAEDELDLARVCPGDPNGSITERTAHALSELIQQADYYIDLHTGGTTASVWPMTGYSLHPEKKILEQQRAMAKERTKSQGEKATRPQGFKDSRARRIARSALQIYIYNMIKL